MAKLKKAIASLVACALMISMLTLDVMAASVSFPVGDATVTGTLIKLRQVLQFPQRLINQTLIYLYQ